MDCMQYYGFRVLTQVCFFLKWFQNLFVFLVFVLGVFLLPETIRRLVS